MYYRGRIHGRARKNRRAYGGYISSLKFCAISLSGLSQVEICGFKPRAGEKRAAVIFGGGVPIFGA